jgi:hypothetical protein
MCTERKADVVSSRKASQRLRMKQCISFLTVAMLSVARMQAGEIWGLLNLWSPMSPF